MKIAQFIFVSLILSFQANAQEPKFEWARSFGGYNSIGNFPSVAVDDSGNVYNTGSYSGITDFDPGIGKFEFKSSGKYFNTFVAKLDRNGNFIWANCLRGTSSGFSIALDKMNNVYITGQFHDTISFELGSGNVSLISVGQNDIFIAKLNSEGEFLWVKQIGGNKEDYGEAISVDSNGNAYVTGQFQRTVDFDPNAGTYKLTALGSTDIFVLKLDSQGNLVWAKNIEDNDYINGGAIVLDKKGNVFITGNFNGKIDFDPGPDYFYDSCGDESRVFILKFDGLGNFLWVKTFSVFSGSVDINIDESGNIFTTGLFWETADFDPGEKVFSLTVRDERYPNMFISKLDENGKFIWALSFGGYESEAYCLSLKTDKWGNLYCTGGFFGKVDFDPSSDSTILSSNGSDDIFVLKLDAAGHLVWCKKIGGTNSDGSSSIAIDANFNLYVSGSFGGTVDFDLGSGVFKLTSVVSGTFMNRDIFVLKMRTTTGIPENTISNIYPNPNNGLFKVVVSRPATEARIEIHNILGVLVYDQTTLTEINPIDLTYLANGLYLVTLTQGNKRVATQKIVKQ